MKAALSALFTVFLLGEVHAESIRYVSDVFYAPLRSGEGNEYRIINKGIRSGTKLAVLEEGGNREWSLVRTPNGEEGWIRSQYLQSEPVAMVKLALVQREIDKLNQLQAENNKLKAKLKQSALQKKLHQSLVKQHQLLQTELEVLKAENARLDDDVKQTWFLYGSGAVGLGSLLTLIIPALRPRKRYSEWLS